LPLVGAGKLKMAFAQTEKDARYKLAHVATRAKSTSAGYTLSGEKRIVVHAPCADQLIVSARTSGDDTDPDGISVFAVDARAPGILMNSYRTIDELRAADVTLQDVHAPADALIGREGEGLALIEGLSTTRRLLCAEAVGAIKYANDATLEHLKTRKQFGAPIGSFQALQHRMVDMVISGEQAKSMAGPRLRQGRYGDRSRRAKTRPFGGEDQDRRCLPPCRSGSDSVARRHGHER
jgi:alkylation response protein AidB-like acyl-CoA dehydrogenase